MQGGIFMGPGMFDIRYRSIDLFDIWIQPHLDMALCVHVCTYMFMYFVPKRCMMVSFVIDEDFWRLFFCTEMSPTAVETLKRAFGSGSVVLPCICMISLPAALHKTWVQLTRIGSRRTWVWSGSALTFIFLDLCEENKVGDSILTYRYTLCARGIGSGPCDQCFCRWPSELRPRPAILSN